MKLTFAGSGNKSVVGLARGDRRRKWLTCVPEWGNPELIKRPRVARHYGETLPLRREEIQERTINESKL